MLRDVGYVLAKLDWMRAERIWPNGLRYLWTDAFGVVLYVSLYRELGEESWSKKAEGLVADVERVLGRQRGIRIGETADRDGQYFHYLAMWLFALGRLGELKPEYRDQAVALARDIHRPFVILGTGGISSAHWLMPGTSASSRLATRVTTSPPRRSRAGTFGRSSSTGPTDKSPATKFSHRSATRWSGTACASWSGRSSPRRTVARSAARCWLPSATATA